MKVVKIFLSSLVLVFMFLGIYLTISFSYNYYKIKQVVIDINEEVDISIACDNLGLFNTALCLNKNVNSFFKYNETNIRRKLTFNQLKIEGGVCTHYTEVYKNAAEKLGFQTNVIDIFPTELEIGHTFLVIFNENGYCILDQNVDVFCVANFIENK